MTPQHNLKEKPEMTTKINQEETRWLIRTLAGISNEADKVKFLQQEIQDHQAFSVEENNRQNAVKFQKLYSATNRVIENKMDKMFWGMQDKVFNAGPVDISGGMI